MIPFLLSLLIQISHAVETPAIFWLSHPLYPGEIGYVAGVGFSNTSQVQLCRQDDGCVNATTVQVSYESVKFIIPSTWKLSIYQLTICNFGICSNQMTINAAEVSFILGAQKLDSGGVLRIFGRSLAFTSTECVHTMRPKLNETIVELVSGETTLLVKDVYSTCYDIRGTLPVVPLGEYKLRIRNRFQKSSLELNRDREPLVVNIANYLNWSSTIFNVKQNFSGTLL